MHPIYPDLRDKHVLITGGANGIGEAVTQAFAQQGCRVSMLDRDAAGGKKLTKKLNDAGGDVRFHAVDLTREKPLVAALHKLENQRGPVDVLVNNAGYDPRYDLTDMTMKQWDDLFRLNIGHYFVTCRELIPGMKEAGGGSIILVGSCNFWVGGDRLAAYTATKGAVLGFMKSLAREVGKHNIRVNTVSPGWVMTQRQSRDVATARDKRRLVNELQCIPRLLTPADIAPAYLFLASDAARMITRQSILVDAGHCMA